MQKVAGERYVYRFACDPDALFTMAFPDSRIPVLKSDSTGPSQQATHCDVNAKQCPGAGQQANFYRSDEHHQQPTAYIGDHHATKHGFHNNGCHRNGYRGDENTFDGDHRQLATRTDTSSYALGSNNMYDLPLTCWNSPSSSSTSSSSTAQPHRHQQGIDGGSSPCLHQPRLDRVASPGPEVQQQSMDVAGGGTGTSAQNGGWRLDHHHQQEQQQHQLDVGSVLHMNNLTYHHSQNQNILSASETVSSSSYVSAGVVY